MVVLDLLIDLDSNQVVQINELKRFRIIVVNSLGIWKKNYRGQYYMKYCQWNRKITVRMKIIELLRIFKKDNPE